MQTHKRLSKYSSFPQSGSSLQEEYWDKTEEREGAEGNGSEVKGTTHPEPGRRAERPGEGERPRTALSREAGSAAAPPLRRRKGGQRGVRRSWPGTGRRRGEEEQPRMLCRKEEVEGGNGGRDKYKSVLRIRDGQKIQERHAGSRE